MSNSTKVPSMIIVRRLVTLSISNRPNRGIKGSSTVELVSIIIIMVPIALLALNVAFLAISGFYNDAACREATRAASLQNNAESARAAANNAIRNYTLAGLGTPQITSFEYNYNLTPPDPDAPLSNPQVPISVGGVKISPDPALAIGEGTGGGGDAPNTAVEMTYVCKVPAPLLIGQTGLTDRVTLRSKYYFPIVAALQDPEAADDSDSGAGDDPAEEPDDPDPPIDPDPDPIP